MSRTLRHDDEIARLRRRAHDPAFAEAWSALAGRADAALVAAVMPAEQGGGWGHHYFCPTHSLPLQFDPRGPGEHRCPVDGENIVGDHMDRAWRSRLSNEALAGALDCARVWLATQDRQHRAHAVAVLLRWCAIYPGLEPHGDIVGLGRVHGTALEESVWGIGLAELADTLLPTLEREQQEAVRSLLEAVLDQVSSELMGKIHNIECWHLASRVTLATVLGRPEVVEASLGGEFGLRAQLRAGILDDGWWAEGSPHYHFYMLRSVVLACLALRHSHPELVASDRLRGMVATPLTMLRPDLSFVALNDGWWDIAEPFGVAEFAPVVEQTWTLWPGPAVTALLARCYDAGYPRSSVEALLHGPDPVDLLHPDELPTPRALHPASGYAVVVDGERSLHLKYGLHGGGHGHPDKLQLDLHVRGVRVMPDLGSPAYNSPLQGPWIRQTLSHNTAAIAGLSQPPVRGVLLSVPHEVSGAVPLVIDAGVHWRSDDPTVHGSWLHEPRAAFPPEYEDAAMRRVVLWSPAGYLVDLLATRVPSGDRTDLGSRLRGDLVLTTTTAPAPLWEPLGPTQPEFLRDPHPLPAGPWRGTWAEAGVRTTLWVCDPTTTTAVHARCPGGHLDEEQSLVLRSLEAGSGTFVSVIDSGGTVVDVTVSAGAVHVTHAGGTDRWTLRDDDGPTRLVGDASDLVVSLAGWPAHIDLEGSS